MKSILTAVFLFAVFAATAQTSDSTIIKKDSVYTEVEVEATFPGGATRLDRYIQSELESNKYKLRSYKKSDTCEVQFIIDKEGFVSEITALTMIDSKLAKVVINAIKKGPRWLPGIQNGRQVKSIRKIKVSFSSPFD